MGLVQVPCYCEEGHPLGASLSCSLAMSVAFDDPNLVSFAWRGWTMTLAQRCGLEDLVAAKARCGLAYAVGCGRGPSPLCTLADPDRPAGVRAADGRTRCGAGAFTTRTGALTPIVDLSRQRGSAAWPTRRVRRRSQGRGVGPIPRPRQRHPRRASDTVVVFDAVRRALRIAVLDEVRAECSSTPSPHGSRTHDPLNGNAHLSP
jgi:hypothetical protein